MPLRDQTVFRLVLGLRTVTPHAALRERRALCYA